MKRILYVWMPHLPIERLRRHTPAPHDPPQSLALVEKDGNIRQITALNMAAREAGLHLHMPVADAQNIHPSLQTLDHDKKADARFLKRLSLWALQFSPLVMQCHPDGLAINITGCAHLHGGEDAMANICSAQFLAQGLTTRIAVADTMGAARALAQYGTMKTAVIPTGQQSHHTALAPLPIAALHPDHDAIIALKRVGLKNIADLKRASRSALRRRYAQNLLTAYDQALGYQAEPFEPLMPPAVYREARNCINPLISFDDLCEAVTQLSAPLSQQLEKAGLGAKRLRLMFFRVDGKVVWFELRIGKASYETAHLARLLHDRLRQYEDRIEAGFGFDRVLLDAIETAPFDHQQQETERPQQRADTTAAPAIAALSDRLRARFGDHAIQRFYPRASHWPERSCTLSTDEGKEQNWHAHNKMRPLSLFNPPQEIDAIAEVPDGPPMRFFWRHQTFEIACAEGPERIAPEWWLLPEAVRKAGPDVIRRFKSRDYYRIEDQDGHRFWVFRRGLYANDFSSIDQAEPSWFLHGLFG